MNKPLLTSLIFAAVCFLILYSVVMKVDIGGYIEMHTADQEPRYESCVTVFNREYPEYGDNVYFAEWYFSDQQSPAECLLIVYAEKRSDYPHGWFVDKGYEEDALRYYEENRGTSRALRRKENIKEIDRFVIKREPLP